MNRWEKTGRILTAAVVFLILALGMFMHILVKDSALSREERRSLAQWPKWSAKAFLDGTWAENIERYFEEQFVPRMPLRRLKALSQYKLFLRLDNNGLYRMDAQLSKIEYPLLQGEVNKAAKKFKEVAELCFEGCELYFCVVPDKNCYLKEKGIYPALDEQRLKQILRDGLDGAGFCEIPIQDLLLAESFYATDTHWAQERILPVAQRIAGYMGVEDRINWQFNEVDAGEFYGVYYGQAAIPAKPDRLIYLTSDAIEQMSVYHLETDTISGVYDTDKLHDEKSVDPYDIFLSGAEAFLEIRNPAGEGQLILLRDSFGSSLAPLLAQAYARVTLIDLRYISTQALSRYLEVEQGADVLFLYSTLSLNHASMLK